MPDNRDVLLVFDGDCGFCTTSARWIERRLPETVAVEPWQSLNLDDYALTAGDVVEAAWWIDSSGRRRRGHMAIGYALIEAGGFWGVVGRVIVTPPISWVANPVYRLVARYRYKLPGATAACRLPDDD